MTPQKQDVDFNGHTILVVEDNLISYKLIEANLSRTNLSLIHASDGKEALDHFANNPGIDLVLMDIQLPVMNGLEVTEQMVQSRPDVPVIATTANTFNDDRQACLNAGCSEYITKPISFDLLFDVLHSHLKG